MKSDNPDQYKQIKALFIKLKDLSNFEQKNYLDSNCHDQQIRKEVENLLFHYTKVDDYWPEAEAESEVGSAFANSVVKLEPHLKAFSELKSSNPVDAHQKEFEGTSRFLIQKRLGAGGFGVVYQAFDQERNSVVALKFLKKDDAKGLYRFKKEFRTLVDISHPNLVTLYELFSQEEQWFFTMEIIDGSNFIDYVRVKKNEPNKFFVLQPLVISTLNRIDEIPEAEHLPATEHSEKASNCQVDMEKLYPALKQLVAGLLALHRANKLHRDIKPSNVLVTENGRVVILDFGLASEFNPEVGSIASDNIFGTPAYMSPEQAVGQAATTASDWYSLGVMLYESLSGVLPFDGSAIEILLKKQRYEPPKLSKLVSGIPDVFVNLCQALLQKDPTLRPNGEQILEIIENLEVNSTFSLNNKAENKQQLKETFVGREKELELLNQAGELTKQGQASTLFIKGHSGIGKSTLVCHFLQQLQHNEKPTLVFRGRCYEQENVPYKVFDSLVDQLSQYLLGLTDLVMETLLPVDIGALVKLFPVFKQIKIINNLAESNDNISDPLEIRRLAFKALKQLLANLANKEQLILFIDDLQWGDIDSVGLLKEILQPPDAPRMLLVGCYRSEEVESSQFLQSFFNQELLCKQFQYFEIDIKGLSKVEAEQLTVFLLGKDSAKQVEKIAQESDGSPFFIGALTKYLMEKNLLNKLDNENEKMTLEMVISSQVESLSPNQRKLLEVVAVAGQPLTHIVAKEASSLESYENLFSILRNSHLIRSTGQSDYQEIDTYHDKIREAVLGQLEPALIKEYNYSLGRVLEGDKELDLERLAKHFRLAEEMDKAFNYTLRAAKQAEKSLAFERAVELYKQLLTLKVEIEPAQTREIQIGLANALANAGRGAQAARVYLSAVANCDGVEQLKLQRKAAEQFLNAGHIEQGLGILNEVLEKVGVRLLNNNLQLLLSIIIGRTKLWFRGINYQQRSESEIVANELVRINAIFIAIDSLVAVNPLQAYDLQIKHLLLALKVGEPFRLARAFNFEGMFSVFSGNRNNKIPTKFIEMADGLAQQINNAEVRAMVNFARCFMSFSQGNWKMSWHYFSVGEEITQKECVGENYGAPLRGIENLVTWGLRALFYQGNIKQLLERLPNYLADGKARENLLMLTNLGTGVVYLNYLAEDKPEKALQELEQTSSLWSKSRFQLHDYWKLLVRAEIGLYSSNPNAVWREINAKWSELRVATNLSIQLMGIEILHFHARVALSMAQNQSNANYFLNIAEKNARKINRKKTTYGDCWAELILAGVEATRGRVTEAIDYLSSAEKKFSEADMMLYAAAASRRRGELLANDAGRDLIKQADDWMIAQQIKNPTRMTNMLAPGNWQGRQNTHQ